MRTSYWRYVRAILFSDDSTRKCLRIACKLCGIGLTSLRMKKKAADTPSAIDDSVGRSGVCRLPRLKGSRIIGPFEKKKKKRLLDSPAETELMPV